MLRIETAIGGENRIPFPITWPDTGQESPEVTASHTVSVRSVTSRGLNLSGYQLLFGCAIFIGLATVFLWALKLWLFQL